MQRIVIRESIYEDMKEFETYTLANGIRGIHRQVRSGVAHCALVVNAGSRDEHKNEYGIAHFTEHALFKGTERRRAYQVNCRLENLGGELNAYTTKEDTTLHATVLRHDFRRAVELIADVMFCSTFPEKELRKEREVIADEINSYKDSPAERIYDDYEDMAFKQIEEPDSDEAELIREIARADYNYNQIVVLYESDPAEFLETYGGIDQMDDIDILMDWILVEEEKSSGEPENV